jgi:UDP-glucose 4-epimerase
MRVLVTGASGFLGHAVVQALLDAGHDVTALSRTGKGLPTGLAGSFVGDVCTPEVVDEAVRDADAVCHLAALARVRDSFAQPAAYWSTNTSGTINVLRALAESATTSQPKRVVLASTGAVYGTPERQPISEDESTNPGNPYAASKLAADRAAADIAATGLLGAVSLRAFNIAGGAQSCGDDDTTRLIPKIMAVQAGRAGELVVNGDGSAVRDFVHVEDMADAFVRALAACTPGQWTAYNVGSGRRTEVRDVIATASDVIGRPVPVRHQPAAPEPPVLLCDPSRISRELGWQARKSDLRQIVSDAWSALTSKKSAGE